MKPIKLKMSAFGSYGGVEEIDFTTVNHGIFLITGDTGAGKTTVFDAITYALFDETSGGKRDGDMMRSQYADETIPTFVEYTFIYAGEEYTIKRNPNYKRISKRKNKDGEYTITNASAAVELILPDGTVFQGKMKETNDKIKEILGVNKKQFNQISMIAQGEFLKLLHASSKERKEIFSRIFDTKIYRQMQNRLHEQSSELANNLKENLNLLNYELSSVWCPTEELRTQWEQAVGKVETGKEEICMNLSNLEVFLQQQQEELEKIEQDHTRRLDEVKIQIAKVQEINQQFQKKRETEHAIQDIQTNLEDLQEKLKKYEDYKEKIETAIVENMPKLDDKLAEARNLLPKYDLLKQRQQETKDLELAQKQALQELNSIEKNLEEVRQQQELYETSQNKLKDEIEGLPEKIQQEKDCTQRKEELQELCKVEKELQKLNIEQNSTREKLQIALDEFEKKSKEYERKNRIFIEEQAGLLAKELVEGKECPVCGATHHPKKAELSKEAVTQQQVEMAKTAREQADKKLEKIRESVSEQGVQYEGLRQVFYSNGQRLFGEVFEQKVQEQALKKELIDCENMLEELEKTRKTLEEKQKRFQTQNNLIQQKQEELKKLQQQKEELQQTSYEKNLAYEKVEQLLQELQNELTYPSKEELENQMQKISQKKRELEENQKTVLEKLQILHQGIAKGEGTLEEKKEQLELLKNSLPEQEPENIASFEAQEKQLLQEKREIEKKKITLISKKDGNNQIQRKVEHLYKEREALMEKYRLVETLSKTANGNLRQQARLDLETYVQRRYFKYMIGEANRRLKEMSNGRFILQCRELEQLGKQGESGLDLDVYDMVTDKVRDIKTLSGGESFLAALSMALGMADVIQKNAGRVHIDTMFIDEGFGMLDEEAMRKTMQILQKLAGENRLIGIISHVKELKEQMDWKLIISKGEKGSHARWQIEN